MWSKKAVSFDHIVHFIDKENIVIFVEVDCGIIFYREAPTKVGKTNRERKNVSRSCEKPKCISSNDQHNCSIDEAHTSNIFLIPYSLWDMDPAALESLNHTKDRDSTSGKVASSSNSAT